jgi:hypothetical protein
MSCFWQGLCSKVPELRNMPVDKVCFNLKSVNAKTRGLVWNNVALTEQQLQENFDWIDQYDSTQFDQGHDTSVCDPFLALVSFSFNVNIVHNYNGHVSTFTMPGATQSIQFANSTTHFT